MKILLGFGIVFLVIVGLLIALNAYGYHLSKKANAALQTDRMRLMLFADLELETLADMLRKATSEQENLNRVLNPNTSTPSNENNPWTLLHSASVKYKEKKLGESQKDLQAILKLPNLETRVTLLAWNALRQMGISPTEKDSDEPRGAIIEMNTKGLFHILAAYEDGRVRFYKFGIPSIIWEADDEEIKRLIKPILTLPNDSLISKSPIDNHILPTPGRVQITFLFLGGQSVIENDIEAAKTDAFTGPILKASENLVDAIERRKSNVAQLGAPPDANSGHR